MSLSSTAGSPHNCPPPFHPVSIIKRFARLPPRVHFVINANSQRGASFACIYGKLVTRVCPTIAVKYARRDNESTVKFSGMFPRESAKIARAYDRVRSRIAISATWNLAGERVQGRGRETEEERREIMVMENVPKRVKKKERGRTDSSRSSREGERCGEETGKRGGCS